MFVFVRKKLAFVEPAKRRFTNCFCVHKINQNKHNFLPKSLAPMDNFVKHFSAGFVFNFLLFSISKLLTFLSQNENKQTTCSKTANANFFGLSLAYSVFLFHFNDFTTVNFNKITFIIGKHFKILTNTISRLRLGDSKPIVTSPSAQ